MNCKRIGFIVNPVAGMGGRVGLKGTDGVVEKAIALGAVPVSGDKALQVLARLMEIKSSYSLGLPLRFITCSGSMGEDYLSAAGFKGGEYDVSYRCGERTSAADTTAACRIFLAPSGDRAHSVDLVLFCGGDGTARDVFSAVGTSLPILGIPAGVKMHSGVFGVNAHIIAELLIDFAGGRLAISDIELIDLDEDAYRKGEWKLRLHGIAKTPFEPNYIQGGKMLFEEIPEETVKQEIANHVIEMMDELPGALFILGPGSTVEAIGRRLGLEKTLLGIDAVADKKLVAGDVNEKALLELVSKYETVKVVLSPIGAQGFILGRGNLQLSRDVVARIGIGNIIVVSTPSKLQHTPILRVDTGDEMLDSEIRKKTFYVVTGYHTTTMKNIE
jgi:predicted polyphosphate/ATP-dependent NAD kinase